MFGGWAESDALVTTPRPAHARAFSCFLLVPPFLCIFEPGSAQVRGEQTPMLYCTEREREKLAASSLSLNGTAEHKTEICIVIHEQ